MQPPAANSEQRDGHDDKQDSTQEYHTRRSRQTGHDEQNLTKQSIKLRDRAHCSLHSPAASRKHKEGDQDWAKQNIILCPTQCSMQPAANE
jgi:hypothetical protein